MNEIRKEAENIARSLVPDNSCDGNELTWDKIVETFTAGSQCKAVQSLVRALNKVSCGHVSKKLCIEYNCLGLRRIARQALEAWERAKK